MDATRLATRSFLHAKGILTSPGSEPVYRCVTFGEEVVRNCMSRSLRDREVIVFFHPLQQGVDPDDDFLVDHLLDGVGCRQLTQ